MKTGQRKHRFKQNTHFNWNKNLLQSLEKLFAFTLFQCSFTSGARQKKNNSYTKSPIDSSVFFYSCDTCSLFQAACGDECIEYMTLFFHQRWTFHRALISSYSVIIVAILCIIQCKSSPLQYFGWFCVLCVCVCVWESAPARLCENFFFFQIHIIPIDMSCTWVSFTEP